jgi:predicted RNase H-like HicB family nuclease
MNRVQNYVIHVAANKLRKLGYDFKEVEYTSVSEMVNTMRQLDGGIQFRIEQAPDGNWVAESINIDGIMTGGKSPSEIPSMLKDAIFTYFEIPPHLSNESLLKGDNEPTRVEQRVHVSA